MTTGISDVEPVVIAMLAARIAKVPTAHPSTPFGLLGLDSIGSIELMTAVEREFGVQLPADAAATCRDARAVASAVEAARRGNASAAHGTDDIAVMRADAELPPDVLPVWPPAQCRAAVPRGLKDARHILLTGVTGFVGRWLARELLTVSAATLTCVVRAGHRDAVARMRAALVDAGVDERTMSDRVHVVDGDLSAPRLGLSAHAFSEVAGRVDAVCHAAADVNWVLPYRALRAVNVGGTLELLRLASVRGVPFHFVSSLAVCYDAPFGYAQTKVVCESLVREAGRRGLPVTIYRPPLVAGHRVTGAFNTDDILARIIAGCVRMGTVPDLDWAMDCVPVDDVVRDVVALSDRRGLFDLRHPRPRQWRECALWMRLYGYEVRLIPYHAWLAQLERETGPSADATHPLRPLRSFFLMRVDTIQGRTLPELMLHQPPLRRRSGQGGSGDESEHAGRDYAPLDGAWLQRYFEAFINRGVLPPPPSRLPRAAATSSIGSPASGPEPHLDAAFFARATGARISRVDYLGRLSDHSIIGELTSWNTGKPTGLFSYRLHMEACPRDVVVKVKARDRDAMAVGEALARLCGEDIGDAYARSADRLGLLGSHARELAIYEQYDPRFVARVPTVLATIRDDASASWMVVLERITGAVLQDAVDDPHVWTDEHIECAVRGLASLHAIWYGRAAELRHAPWIGHVSSTADIAGISDLWTALARHAAPRFSAWAHPTLASTHRALIDRVAEWRAPLDAAPLTLVHNDFNPRNVCIRRDPRDGTLRLAAYDWELATIGAPQRDLAEFLCFVLPTDVSRESLDRWIERHRTLLEQQTGRRIDGEPWREGFRASLFDLMLTRLPMYALIHRVRPQPFLPRVTHTWWKLYSHVQGGVFR